MGYIYLLSNTLGYSYVGKTTKTVDERFKEHCKNALYGLNANLITTAMRKYGIESFAVTELTSSNDAESLDSLERQYIQTLKTHINESPFGLNATVGGQGTSGYSWRDESREKKIIKSQKNLRCDLYNLFVFCFKAKGIHFVGNYAWPTR